MRKSMLTMAVFFCYVAAMMAERVSPAEAREAAAKFLHAQGVTLTDNTQQPHRSRLMTSSSDTPAYYVFNADAAQGFVVVSGDDCVGDNLVLGYAPQGCFSETNVPDGLQWWLETTARQIGELSRMGVKVGAMPTHNAIAPMLTSQWDQALPYNACCPAIGGKLSVTGCMATALAQVMYYYRWPQEPLNGTLPAYTMIDGTEIEALPVTQFDWDNMLDSYQGNASEAQQRAVAELMRYCGQSLQMIYSPVTSDGICYDLDLLVNNFGYDPGLYSALSRSYTVSGWDALIYNELYEGRPLVYTGHSTGGGHAFVIDGYDVESGEGYYHVNWGWSGNGNGFYKINLLNPSTSGTGGSATSDGYNNDQRALIGFQPRLNPSQPFYRHLSPWGWDQMDNATTHKFMMMNQSYKSGIFSIGIVERKEDGTPDLTKVVCEGEIETSGFTTASLMTDGKKGSVIITISNENAPDYFKNLDPGRHKLMFVSRHNVIGAPWEPIYGPNSYIEVNIDEKRQLQEMIVHPQQQLSISDENIKVEGPHQRGIVDNVHATFNNTGSDDYIGYVECAVYPLKDGILQKNTSLAFSGIMIEAGGTADVYFGITVPQDGDYVILLTKGGLGNYETGRALTDIQQAKGYLGHKCSSFDELRFYCLGAQYVLKRDKNENLQHCLDISLKNETSLDYDAVLMIKIFKHDGSDYVPFEFPSVPDIYTYFLLPDGQSEDCFLPLPDALDAGDYRLDLYIANNFHSFMAKDYFMFTSVPLNVDPTGILEIPDSEFKVQGDDVWYDLTGRKFTERPTKKGIYIYKGKKVIINN